MDTIKGLLFSLESQLKTAKPSLFKRYIMVSSKDALSIIEKLKQAIDAYDQSLADPASVSYNDPHLAVDESSLLVTVQKETVRLKKEANDYVDDVLSRLQLSVTKMQQHIIKIEKNIVEGRKLIQKKQRDHIKGDTNET